VFSGLKRQILQVMKASGLHDVIGQHNIFSNEDFALEEIYKRLELDASGDACPLLKREHIPL
jgi:SulP family sulfate permease